MHNLLCAQGHKTSMYISWQWQVSPLLLPGKCIWLAEEIAMFTCLLLLPIESCRFWHPGVFKRLIVRNVHLKCFRLLTLWNICQKFHTLCLVNTEDLCCVFTVFYCLAQHRCMRNGTVSAVFGWLFTYLMKPYQLLLCWSWLKMFMSCEIERMQDELQVVHFLVFLSCLLRELGKITFNLKSWQFVPLKYEYKKLPFKFLYSISTESDLQLWSISMV